MFIDSPSERSGYAGLRFHLQLTLRMHLTTNMKLLQNRLDGHATTTRYVIQLRNQLEC